MGKLDKFSSKQKEAESQSALVNKNETDDAKPRQVGGYPVSIFFIIGNEFCERFSYYGMKTVLTLYFVQYLYYDKDTSTMIYHTFSMLCYFTPIIGAIISDSLLGKFKTIFYISIVYVAGNVVLSVSAIPGYAFQSAITMLGLALIAFGTGGIKPCVAAFGGDQFVAGQELQLERFFSLFYMSINAGSLLSTVITPMLRGDIQCFDDDCYALAFGVPAGLMVVALGLFLIGKPMYKMNPPEGNVIVKVTSCMFYAFKNKGKRGPREHWLDNADDKYDKPLIEDIKAVLHVLVLYIPLPVFWALFDQQGSRWLLQATQMDGNVFNLFRVKPDQVQVVNPLLIVICIPLFQYAIYPLLNKCHLVRTPLQRITVGGMLAAVSFVVAAFVELALEKTLPVKPGTGLGHATMISNINCDLRIGGFNLEPQTIKFGEMIAFNNVPADQNITFVINPDTKCSLESKNVTYFIKNQGVQLTYVYEVDQEIYFETVIDSLEKPEKAESNVRVVFNLNEFDNGTFKLRNEEKTYDLISKTTNISETIGITDYALVIPNTKYDIILSSSAEKFAPIEVQSGGSYIVQLSNNKTQFFYTQVKENSMSILIQIPQYVIITFGEIMFSITGLEFSYSQAPASMKSVLQAGWLMTVAFGNLIVVIVSTAAYLNQAYEFFMFAGLMVLDMIIFAIMAYYYQYINQSPAADTALTDGDPIKSKSPHSNGHTNDGFEDPSRTTPM